MGSGQANGQYKQVGRFVFGKKKEAGVHTFIVCGKVVFLAGMTRAVNCTILSGAVFKQYKLITGKNLGMSTVHA